MHDALAGVEWADPTRVRLPTFVMDSDNPHRAKFGVVPAVPPTEEGEEPARPYLLAHGLGSAEEDERVRRLKARNDTNPVIIFGALSGPALVGFAW